MNRRKLFKTIFGAVGASIAAPVIEKLPVPISGDSRLPKIVIPMVRRTFPILISSEIVDVQPMSDPIGQVFYLNYKTK